jgi:hypothetical protein
MVWVLTHGKLEWRRALRCLPSREAVWVKLWCQLSDKIMHLYLRASVVMRAFSTWRDVRSDQLRRYKSLAGRDEIICRREPRYLIVVLTTATWVETSPSHPFPLIVSSWLSLVTTAPLRLNGKLVCIFFFCSAPAELWPRSPHCWSFQITHRHTHPVALFWTSDTPLAQAATYTTHNTHIRWTSMLSLGFELAILEIDRPQTYALELTAILIDYISNLLVSEHTVFH